MGPDLRLLPLREGEEVMPAAVPEEELEVAMLAGMRRAVEIPVRGPLPVRMVSGPVLMALPGVIEGRLSPPQGPVGLLGPARCCRRPRRSRLPRPRPKHHPRQRCRRPRRPRRSRLPRRPRPERLI